MTKIAIISDTHYGIRSDSEIFHDNNKKFLDEIFFPYLKTHKIEKLFHLGDLVDRRKYINFNTSRRLREDFLDPLEQLNIETHIILGNHDVYHKNTNEINAIKELVDSKYKNFTIYYEPKDIQIFDTSILMVPWICDENRNPTEETIKKSKSPICMGHFELSGFEMFKGSMVSHGDDPENLNKFDLVFSGHYHHKSNKKNIYYLGSHAEFTWSDYDDPKGFHVFDLKTRHLEFIQNPYTMFKKIYYDDIKNDYSKFEFIKEEYNNRIIKVIVSNKTNAYYFDKFIDSLEQCSPFEFQILDNEFTYTNTDEVDEAESTIDIFKNYIDKTEIKNIDKKDLQNIVLTLYNEALSS